MKCPVCKTECHSELVCPECGFDDISPVFLSKEDGEAWLENVVLPRRLEYWETLEDFEIEGTELKKYHGENTTVIIPYGIERIGKSAFNSAVIREVIFPETVKVIGECAFMLSRLQAVFFSSGLEKIDNWAFLSSSLVSVMVPATCKEICTQAFLGCSNLKTVHISHGVERIGVSAFGVCSNIEYIAISPTVSDIETGAFSTGSSKMKIFIDPRNEKYAVINNCLIEKKLGKIISATLNDGIPADADISIIGEDAYYGSPKEDDGVLVVPPNINTIERSAFSGCHITKAFIPRTVKKIGGAIFSGVENCSVFVEAKNKLVQWDENWCGAKKSYISWGKRWKIKDDNPEIVLLDKNKYSATLISYSYDEDEDQMKMFIRLTNRSDMQVRFVIADLSIDDDTSTVTHWCTVDPNSETRCEYIFNDGEFAVVYLGTAEEITFEIKVKDDDDQYVFAESELITLPGFYDPDEDDEDDGELPF